MFPDNGANARVVFTKCKESLQEGRRLENISWRLWYREMMLEGEVAALRRSGVEEGGVEKEMEKEASLESSTPLPPAYDVSLSPSPLPKGSCMTSFLSFL